MKNLYPKMLISVSGKSFDVAEEAPESVTVIFNQTEAYRK